MKSKLKPIALLVAMLSLAPLAQADEMLTFAEQGSATLPGTPSYYWWYGCSPTAAGMMLGLYDRNGYKGQSFSNLIAGGSAESTTFPSTAGTWQYLAQYAIASPGNVSDYYRNGYNASGDDVVGAHHANNSLADFMGTSQDYYGNSNGGSAFYYFSNGTKLTYQMDVAYHLDGTGTNSSGVHTLDAMYGLTRYVASRGYTVANAYTQVSSNVSTAGFTFNNFKNEIDQGRAVLIQVTGHTMLGFGYNDNGTINIYDTWSQAANTMSWGGTYSGMSMWGVTVLDLAVPEPGTLPVLAAGLSLLVGLRRRQA